MLAKLMAQPSNLLILDEPTNDLDVETLDLLQDILGKSTTARSCWSALTAISSTGWPRRPWRWRGRAARPSIPVAGPTMPPSVPTRHRTGPDRPRGRKPRSRLHPPTPQAQVAKAGGLTFTERKRLDELPALIDRLESEIGKLLVLLETPELYTREPVKFRKATEALSERQSALDSARSSGCFLPTGA